MLEKVIIVVVVAVVVLLCWPQVWHGGSRTDQQAIMRAVMQRMWTAMN